ncbi:30S ribosome-binding factor RbfA [Macrococcoides canis]|uniref:Ribosome-binding factor A n=1 Tax=Macrococcoides canis TaxID=1855823 RepID=A0A1W7AAU3_9STAP|nr:30S ribosome-binding factor RbfA [Macrococcus canis]ARQ06743.1 Ribosome-binding factor A [Macrococcus canis]MEE1107525.1 30S ribosome-binding factor RbfA [Macrococcus canis]QCT74695.1 30S ribosome-binding factor RbfA [Macrococcus canis]QIH75763.1 30S ribosome-binding factor RbfA [Macrococcus canis]QIH78209.1 30S ribosome-binding factor RbfA [Macrococcus canis]
MSLRSERVGEQLKKEISEIINQKLKNPNVGFVTVTEVEVTGDLSLATVYVTVLGEEKERKKSLEGLEKSKGFIKSEIAHRMDLRIVPDLKFKYDESIDYGNKIERMIAELNRDK